MLNALQVDRHCHRDGAAVRLASSTETSPGLCAGGFFRGAKQAERARSGFALILPRSLPATSFSVAGQPGCLSTRANRSSSLKLGALSGDP
jgi:hypothetical protein